MDRQMLYWDCGDFDLDFDSKVREIVSSNVETAVDQLKDGLKIFLQSWEDEGEEDLTPSFNLANPDMDFDKDVEMKDIILMFSSEHGRQKTLVALEALTQMVRDHKIRS